MQFAQFKVLRVLGSKPGLGLSPQSTAYSKLQTSSVVSKRYSSAQKNCSTSKPPTPYEHMKNAAQLSGSGKIPTSVHSKIRASASAAAEVATMATKVKKAVGSIIVIVQAGVLAIFFRSQILF